MAKRARRWAMLGSVLMAIPWGGGTSCRSALEPAMDPKVDASPGASRGHGAAPVHGKVAAPVDIHAEVGAASAHVTLRFAGVATDVAVRIRGVEGLRIESDGEPIDGATFAAGQQVTLEVRYAGSGHLVVLVQGRFGSVPLARVTSFTVGDGTSSVGRAKQGGAEVHVGGRRAVPMPVERRDAESASP